MSLIVQTGKKHTVSHKERCANCGRNLQIGEVAVGVQVHPASGADYTWGSIHYPECPIKTKTWYKNNG